MTKRVAVSGCGGFVGAHVLAHILNTTDWDVVAIDSFRHKGKTDRIWQTMQGAPDGADWGKRLTVITHDMAAPVTWQMANRMGEVNYFLALASESHVDRSISDPLPFVRNNTELIMNTLEFARQWAVEHTIVVSTDEVYGPVEADDITGHAEWAPILPSNPYAASKAAQEALAIAWWRTYGVPLTIVNCMNMIGEMQDPEKFVPMLIKGISANQPVTIHGTPDHIGTRHYLHARNLADSLVWLLQRGSPAMFPAHIAGMFGSKPADRPDRYNIVGPDRVDNLTLANTIADIIGEPLRYELQDFHTTRPGHDPHYGLDGTKITDLGWKPPMPFDASLEKTVMWTLRHPQWLL